MFSFNFLCIDSIQINVHKMQSLGNVVIAKKLYFLSAYKLHKRHNLLQIFIVYLLEIFLCKYVRFPHTISLAVSIRSGFWRYKRRTKRSFQII